MEREKEIKLALNVINNHRTNESEEKPVDSIMSRLSDDDCADVMIKILRDIKKLNT